MHENQQATVRVTAKGEMDECALVQDGLMCMVEDNKQIQTQHPSKPWHSHRLHSYESINLFLARICWVWHLYVKKIIYSIQVNIQTNS